MSIFQKGLFGGSSSSGGGGSGTGWDGRVNTFADLPSAAANNNKYYMVDQATGTVGVDYKSSGIYRSDGTAWTLRGTPPLTSVLIGGILVSAAALGVFGSSTIKVTPDAINGTMTIEGNDTLQSVTARGATTTADVSMANVSVVGLRVGMSTTSGYVLTADAGGNATWQNAAVPTVISSRIPSPWSRYASSSTSTVLATSDNGFTVNSVYVQLNPMNQSTQLNGNLRYSDYNGSNPYLICALDTTNGSATITSMTNAVVPAGKRVYIDWDDAPAITIDEQVAAINVTRVP